MVMLSTIITAFMVVITDALLLAPETAKHGAAD